MRNYIGISRDRRTTDTPIVSAAGQHYSKIIASIKENAVKHSIETMVSIAKADFVVGSPGYIPVNDSIHSLIDQLIANGKSSTDTDIAYVILCIIDDIEISSIKWDELVFDSRISELQDSGYWSFIFHVPFGCRDKLLQCGMLDGNIHENNSLINSATEDAFTKMFNDRASGNRTFSNFYN